MFHKNYNLHSFSLYKKQLEMCTTCSYFVRFIRSDQHRAKHFIKICQRDVKKNRLLEGC